MVPIVPNGNKNVGGDQLWIHWDDADVLVTECGIILNLYYASIIANCHNVGEIFVSEIAHSVAFIIVRFTSSAKPFICGWCGIFVVCCMPMWFRKACTSCDVYSSALSEWNFSGVLLWYDLICVSVVWMMLGTLARVVIGWAIKYRLNLSTNVIMCRWIPVEVGAISPILSLLIFWPGWVVVSVEFGCGVCRDYPAAHAEHVM